MEKLSSVGERSIAKNDERLFEDVLDQFDCDVSDEILVSMDLPLSVPSFPTSSGGIVLPKMLQHMVCLTTAVI